MTRKTEADMFASLLLYTIEIEKLRRHVAATQNKFSHEPEGKLSNQSARIKFSSRDSKII